MPLLHDLYYAWRSLAKTPGFLIVAVLSLALGIGANTALFSLVYSALYKTLPVKNADRLVIFNDPAPEGMSMGSSSGERGLMTWPEFQQLQNVKPWTAYALWKPCCPKCMCASAVVKKTPAAKWFPVLSSRCLGYIPPLGDSSIAPPIAPSGLHRSLS